GQYRYPMFDLPRLRRVPALIFGVPQPPPAAEGPGVSDGEETHLDRELDIRFSGDIFNAVCRGPFLDIALPLFDRRPAARQPAMVVDTGCGDGTVLAALYDAIRSRTERGRRIEEHPLLMVGADPSPVAREIAASRLSAAGVPHLVLDGDIADPERLRRDLAERGLDAGNALHICKSAIHDRAYRGPDVYPGSGKAPARESSPPRSFGAFALPDGGAVAPARMARDLAGLFRSWLPLTREHGWLVIEAHTVAPETAADLVGQTLVTSLDATHGYSCQYLTEPEVFAWAAREGGFSSLRHAEPANRLGHVLLTIDHFVADTYSIRETR
ncbi:MAG: class I SAM-dependent methyltransferase, partial [Trebonia sp.]